MIEDQLYKVMEMRYDFTDPYIIVCKPNEEIIEYDTDNCDIKLTSAELEFCFEGYEDFSVRFKDIKSIKFEDEFDEEMSIIHINLKNDEMIMLHFLKF